MKRIPAVGAAMTPFPYSVAPASTVKEARAMMEEHQIQHLPVMEKDAVLGLLFARDLDAAVDFAPGVDADAVLSLARPNPYVVDFGVRLDIVVAEMAERGEDSALVIHQGHLAGILTATDVCRILADCLREITTPPFDDDAA